VFNHAALATCVRVGDHPVRRARERALGLVCVPFRQQRLLIAGKINTGTAMQTHSVAAGKAGRLSREYRVESTSMKRFTALLCSAYSSDKQQLTHGTDAIYADAQ
jgi:negative regulator of replication initiation